MVSTSNAKKKMSLQKKHNLIGWAFLIPASLLIFVFCFYPMFQAILLSFKKGMGEAQTWAGIPEQVNDGKSGYLVAAGDNQKFAEMLREVMQMSAEQYDAMSREAYQYGSKKYATGGAVERFVGLLNE